MTPGVNVTAGALARAVAARIEGVEGGTPPPMTRLRPNPITAAEA